VAMFGAYMALTLVTRTNSPFLGALVFGILGAGLLSIFNEKVAYKRIRDHGSPTMFLMIAAMGISTTYQNGAMLAFGPKFQMFPSMFGLKYSVYPTMGNVSLKAFIASVLGGLGSVRGAIVGALIIGVLETMVSGYLSSGLRDLVTFGLLIVILLVKPSGLMGVTIEDKA